MKYFYQNQLTKTSFSKVGKTQQPKLNWLKQYSKTQKSRNHHSSKSPQLLLQQPEIKITLNKNEQNKKKMNISTIIYTHRQINRKQQPFTVMLSRQKAQKKKDKSPENYHSVRSIFDRVSELRTFSSKKQQKLKSQESKYSIQNTENKINSSVSKVEEFSIPSRKIKGYVDLKRRQQRILSYQNNLTQTPAPGQYEIIKNEKFPTIRFQKQIRREYYYKSQNINHLDYYPNYRFIRKRGDLQTINFKKQSKRKPIINRLYCYNYNSSLIDYPTNKIQEKALLEFDKMIKKNDQTFPNYMTAFGNKHIAVNINQQKIQQIQ